MFKRTTGVSDADRDKLAKVLVPEFMSSEDSCGSDEDTITIRPLPWRSRKVSDFFTTLSEHAQENKSNQAKRQTKRRIVGDVSDRSKPLDDSIPKWAFAKEYRKDN